MDEVEMVDLDYIICEHADGANDEPKLCPLDTEIDCQCCDKCRNESQLEADDA